MKSFVSLLFIFFLSLFLALVPVVAGFNKQKYISEKVLDYSRPINVKIDVGTLRGLSPAYEQ